jgi:SET domain-containing protein
VAVSFEHGHEASDSIKDEECIEQLNNCWCIMEELGSIELLYGTWNWDCSLADFPMPRTMAEAI